MSTTPTTAKPSLTFTDASGRSWNLKITLGINNRLKDAKLIDLTRIQADKMKRYKELMSDPAQLAAAVWEIIKPQAETADVTADQFLESLDGEAIDAMIDVFTQAIADFSRPLQGVILKGLQRGKESQAAMVKGATAAMDEADMTQIEQQAKAVTAAAVKRLTSGLSAESSTNAADGSD